MSDSSLRMEAAEEMAASLGLMVITPEPDEVMVDLDSPQGELNSDVLKAIRQSEDGGLNYQDDILYMPSKSGNRHAIIKFNHPLNDLERIVLQACLGSDPVREVLSLIRQQCGADFPSVLFQVNDIRVKLWRARVNAVRDLQCQENPE